MSRTLRLRADAQAQSVVDTLTGRAPEYYRGDDLRIEGSLVSAGTELLAAGVGTITLEVKPKPAKGGVAAVIRETLGTGDCDGGYVAGDWEDGGELFAVEVAAADAAVTPGAYELLVLHESAGGLKQTYARIPLTVHEAVVESLSLNAPPAPAASYWNKTEADARYALASALTTTNATVTGHTTALADRVVKSAPTISANFDFDGNDLTNGGTLAAATVTMTAAPSAADHATRKDYVDQFGGWPYAQAIMTGGLNVVNSGSETRAPAVGSAGTHSALWLATDGTSPLEVAVTRRSQNSPVEVSFCLHGGSSANDTPVHVILQRNLDPDGAGSWVTVAQGDAHNSAQRVTATLAASESDNKSLSCAALTLLDATPVGSGVSKVAYRVLVGVDPGDSLYLNQAHDNRVARLDGSDGIAVGTQDDMSGAVSTLLAKELYTP